MLYKIYLVLVSLKALISISIISVKKATDIIINLAKNLSRSERKKASRIFWRQIIVPNFRKKRTIQIGRPSASVYEKFPNSLIHVVKDDESVGRPNFLLIRNGAMGDVLMLTPSVRGLFEAHNGDINIDVATFFPRIFDNSPYVRSVLSPKEISKGIHNYDCVIDLNGVYERNSLHHPVDVYMKFSLNKQIVTKSLDLFPTKADEDFIDEVVRLINGPYVVVHQVHHEWPNRNISKQIWDKISNELAYKLGLKVIYIGGFADAYARDEDRFEDHRNRYTLQQLSVLIAKSNGFIGGDSGPAHVAATTQAPICCFYTCAHHDVRKPLRDQGKFLPIFPKLDCYGCLATHPFRNTSYYCKRGDNACTSDEYLGDASAQVLDFLS
jgi:ADP-heptose:LPS heptosyltransferase